MKTRTAINPFEHRNVFFLTGLALALVLVQIGLRWNGMSLQTPAVDIPKVEVGQWVEVITHTEKKVEVMAEPEVKEPLKTILHPEAEIKQVDDKVVVKQPIKLASQFDGDVPIKGMRRGNSTTTNTNSETTSKVYDVVEHDAVFPGGYAGLYEYIAKNIKYPVEAKNLGIEGTVYVQFVVNSFGQVSQVEILRGIGFGCDEEVIRVIESLPNWQPAMQGNQKVNLRLKLPVKFKIDN